MVFKSIIPLHKKVKHTFCIVFLLQLFSDFLITLTRIPEFCSLRKQFRFNKSVILFFRKILIIPKNP